MDIDPLDVVRKVWRHAGRKGHVWMPHIQNIGHTTKERFREGAVINPRTPKFPDLNEDVDWYWTPAVSSSDSRKAKAYPEQRVVWVDCDESYDVKLLEALKPSYMWETSPGHRQAVWLLKDPLPKDEFHRDGFMGMLTHALGGDKSGVDVGQLLRVPGTWHHKRKPFQGRLLRSTGTVYTRGRLLGSVARSLGFPASLASELGADDPYGDRSKLLWKFARTAAELGLDQKLTFKLIRACAWNKWRDEPDRLREDIANAYAQQPPKDTAQEQAEDHRTEHEDEDQPVEAWGMATVDKFGPVIRQPVSWIVPGIIPEAGCGLLVAAPKVGKTRIAIEIALGLATGRRPLGLSIRKQVPVGFFSMEDGEHLFAERLSHGINTSRGRERFHWDGHIKPDMTWHPPEPMGLFTNFANIDLSDNLDKQRLAETIQKYELKLVIIDTLSVSIGRTNVSDIKEMNGILPDLREIATATGCAIMFIHHTRKRVFEKGETIQESVLGSTALHAWCDFIMNLVSPEEDSDLLRLGVQTKRGGNMHYIDTQLKIIKRPKQDDE